MDYENYPELTEDQHIATSLMVGFIQEVFKATDPLKLVQRVKGFDPDKEQVIADLIDTARITIETNWEVSNEGT